MVTCTNPMKSQSPAADQLCPSWFGIGIAPTPYKPANRKQTVAVARASFRKGGRASGFLSFSAKATPPIRQTTRLRQAGAMVSYCQLRRDPGIAWSWLVRRCCHFDGRAYRSFSISPSCASSRWCRVSAPCGCSPGRRAPYTSCCPGLPSPGRSFPPFGWRCRSGVSRNSPPR